MQSGKGSWHLFRFFSLFFSSPGIFRGALDVRARAINEPMKLAAAHAIAAAIPEDHLTEDYIVPSVFEKRVVRAVARAVAKAAHESGVARRRERQAP